MIKVIHADGSELQDGETAVCDNFTNSWQVSIRSMGRLGTIDLTQLLQTKYEVTEIEETDYQVIGGLNVVTFFFSLRGMRPIGPNDLRQLIDTKYEIIELQETGDLLIVDQYPCGTCTD